MGAGASALSGDSAGTGGSMFEALKAQEEAKTFYTKRIAETLAKNIESLKAKGTLSQEEMEKEILLVLQVNEPYIMEKPLPGVTVPPSGRGSGQSFRKGGGSSFSENRHASKGARRRSFDNLVHDDIAQRNPKSYDEPAPKNMSLTPGHSGRFQMNNSGRVSMGDGGEGSTGNSMRINSFVSEGGGHYSSADPEAHFRKLCVESVRQIASKKNLTFMAAVDGSEGGHVAFQTMMLMKKKLDYICVFHAYSKEDSAEELPPEYQADAVRSRYENELITKLHLPTTKFAFYWEEKKKRNIRKVIMELLNNYKGVKNPMRPTRNEPNFFFCGYTGTKGNKVDNSTLGSVTDIALRSVHMPVVICKALCSSTTRVFVIAVDGSENSRNGFDIAMALVNPKDKLYCVTVEAKEKKKSEEGKEEKKEEKAEEEVEGGDELDQKVLAQLDMSATALRDYYSSELQSYGPADCEFVSLPCLGEPGRSTVAECLVQFSDSVQADFFAISPRAQPILTSVTEYIIATVKANIILCKN